MNAEPVLTCADCEGELAMLRVTKTILRLGHVKEPHPIHAPRLARAEHDPLRARAQLGALDKQRRDAPVPDASSDRRSSSGEPLQRASMPVHSSPAGRRVERGSPRPSSASARSAGSHIAGEGI